MTVTTMTSLAALSAGLATSLHCIGMCGPLACSVTSRCKSKQHAQLESLAYHFGRTISYTIIGSLAGLIAFQPLNYFFYSPAALLPWMMIPFLIVTAFPSVFKMPRLKFLTMPYYRAKRWAESKPPGIMGGMLGIISPALPCTPLYMIFGVCLMSGSPLSGARIALCFALGTIPLLWAAQSSTHLIAKFIPGRWRSGLRVSFLLTVTVLLFIRLQGALPLMSQPIPDSAPQEGSQPTQQPATIFKMCGEK